MITTKTKTQDDSRRVLAATEKAAYRNFGHAAASIRKTAVASIVKSDESSEPGEPPHTRGKGGKNLKTAIRFAADKEGAVIGPRASVIGESAARHEHGEDGFSERPFMAPALEANEARFAESWEGSIGE